jgi:hypothetical protein
MSGSDPVEVMEIVQLALRTSLRERGRQLAVICAVLYIALLFAVVAATVWASFAV